MIKKILIAMFCITCFWGNIHGQVIKEGQKSKIIKEANAYTLYFNNKPYYVNGTYYGGKGNNSLGFLSAKGANSIRVGADDLDKVIGEAIRLKLTVLVSLSVRGEYAANFNYNDELAVKKQFDENKAIVTKYKNNPYIVFWGIGNELSLFYTNKKVWKAVNELSKMVHEVSPNHLTLTITGDSPLDVKVIEDIKTHCPDLDLLGVNQYGGIENVDADLKKFGWEKPYLITEWGPTGHWQVAKNKWNLAIEETSSEKARIYKWRYENAIKKNNSSCIGSYVFYWGQKQEITHTWYGMFLETGQQLEVVDVMEFLWKGKWPAQLAPGIDSVRIDGFRAEVLNDLYPGSKHDAEFTLNVNNNKSLRVDWRVYPEPKEYSKYAGWGEVKPQETPVKYERVKLNSRVIFTAPEAEGNYRMFVTVFGDNNKAAVANFPFHVKKKL